VKVGIKKLRVPGLPDAENHVNDPVTICVHTVPACDGQMDEQRDHTAYA